MQIGSTPNVRADGTQGFGVEVWGAGLAENVDAGGEVEGWGVGSYEGGWLWW